MVNNTNNNKNKKKKNNAASSNPGSRQTAFTRTVPRTNGFSNQPRIRLEPNKFSNRLSGTVVVGDVLASPHVQQIYNCYTSWYTTRLGAIMATYDKWYMHSIVLEYVPAVPATQAGTIAMCCEYDVRDLAPDTTTTTGFQTPSTVMSGHPGYVQGRLTEGLKTAIRNQSIAGRPLYDHLYVDNFGDERLENAGKFYVLTDAYTGLSEDDVVGKFLIHYDVTLSCPNVTGTRSALLMDDTFNSMICNQDLTNNGGVCFNSDYIENNKTGANTAGISLYDTVATAKVARNSTRVYEAIFEGISSGTVKMLGKTVAKGTKIFFKVASIKDGLYDTSHSGVGRISTTKDFVRGIVVDAAIDALIELSNIYLRT